MATGYETYRADGTVITSTERSRSMVFVEFLQLQPGNSSSKSYPLIAPGGLIINKSSNASHTVVVGVDASGSPNITWTAGPYNANTDVTRLAVMATKLTATGSGMGINVANAAGDVFMSSDYASPQCVGYVDVDTNATNISYSPDGYWIRQHRTTVPVSAGLSANRMIVMGLPDSGTDDIWYATDVTMLPAGQSYTVTVLVFTKSGSSTGYTLPRLFIFAIDYVSPTSNGFGIQVSTPAQKLLYDSTSENMGLMDVLSVSYQFSYIYGSKAFTFNQGAATYIGVTFPGCWWEEINDTRQDVGYGAVKKVGSQLSFNKFRTARNAVPAGTVAVSDAYDGLFCAVVDLTYLGFATAGATYGGGGSASAPTITTQPQPQSGYAGTIASFSVTAAGTAPLSYQWYQNNVAMSGATGSALSVSISSTNDGSYFKCRAGNAYGSADSNNVPLTMLVSSGGGDPGGGTPPDPGGGGTPPGGGGGTTPPAPTPVYITSDISGTNAVQEGSAVSFSVAVAGTAPFVYQWYRNGSPVAGATANSFGYTVSMANNGDTVYCRITNNSGANAVTTSSMTVTVTAASTFNPVITLQPTNVTANQGQVVYMRCEASPADRFAWYRNGAYFTDGQSVQLVTSTLGTSTYYCLVYSGARTTQSQTATLSVVGPSQSPYASYNNISLDVDTVDNDHTFAIFDSGSTSETGYPWANGVGSGALYRVTASANFTPGPGSDVLGSPTTLTANWVFPKPTSTAPGATVTRTLSYTIYLNSSAVASGTIRVTLRNSGGVVN